MTAFSNDVWFILPNWKWISLVVALLAGFLLKSLLKTFFKSLKDSGWLRSRAHGFFLNFLNTEIQTPLAWILTSLFWVASIDALQLPLTFDKYLKIVIQLVLSLHLIVLAYKAIEAFGEVLIDFSRRSDNPLSNELAPMITKVLKVFVVIFGVLIAIQNFGINVMSVLAGLGLGGLALALAAQDTAANLFGSLMIVIDRPFKVGDLIKVADTEGTVEEVGFRSTRIRTLTNTLVSIPNSVVAKEKIDNYQLRTQRRIRHILGLTYDTPEAKMKAFMLDVERYLQGQHDVDPASIQVKFIALGDFSLQILVQFFVNTAVWQDELEIQEDLLMQIRRSAEKFGVDFAFPTNTQIVNLMDYQAVAEMGARNTPPSKT